MNRSGYIIAALRAAGVNAFAAGEHEGICTEPYCVVRQLSGVLDGGGGRARYRITVLVPAAAAHTIDEQAQAVCDAMRPLEAHGLIIAQPRGTTLTEDRFRAVTTCMDYVSYYS